MPPKNCELEPGRLFMFGPDGVELYVGSIGEGIPKIPIQYDDSAFDEIINLPYLDDTFEFEGKIMMNPSKIMYYLLVKSNNWLKMHGYPMVRGRYVK